MTLMLIHSDQSNLKTFSELCTYRRAGGNPRLLGINILDGLFEPSAFLVVTAVLPSEGNADVLEDEVEKYRSR